MTLDAEVGADRGGRQAGRDMDGVRPLLVAGPDAAPGTGLILFPGAGALPAVWVGFALLRPSAPAAAPAAAD